VSAPRQSRAGRAALAPVPDPAEPREPPEFPDGCDRSSWVRAGAFGTDGCRTWRLDADRWRPILDASLRIVAERCAAPDPDFPDRAEDGDDAGLEASADVEVSGTHRGRRRVKL
jgi:hypothetical protein